MFHHPDQEEGEKIFPWEISGLRKYCGVCHVFIERRSEWAAGMGLELYRNRIEVPTQIRVSRTAVML